MATISDNPKKNETHLSIISLKQNYLEFMEQINAGFLFPPNYIKIYCVLMMHPKGITQEEIQILTNIPLGPVSELIQSLIDEGWAEKLPKIPGIRKRTYIAKCTFPQYFSTLFDKISTAYLTLSKELPLILDLIHQLGAHPMVDRDHKFFDFMKWLIDTMIEMFKEGIEQIQNPVQLMQTIEDKAIMSDNNYWELLKTYPAFTQEVGIFQPKSQNEQNIQILGRLKDIRSKFYNIIASSANFMGVNSDLGIITLYFLLCGTALSQEDLIEEFNLPRSRISRNLRKLEDYNLITHFRKPSSRTILYQTRISLAQLIIGKMDGFVLYSIKVKEYIRNLLQSLDNFKNEDDFGTYRQFFLSNIEAYTMFERLGRYLQRQLYFRVKALEKHPIYFFQKK
jgi:DNA-binding transcriptional regulator GbsR (MarR family)